MSDWQHLTTYTEFLELINAQYEYSVGAIDGEEDAHDEIFTDANSDEVGEKFESLKQIFSESQLPLLNIMAEDMYDTVLAHKRLSTTFSFDRNFYYSKAAQEYQKYQAKIELQRALYEKYVDAHRNLL